jgi:hypothetical protein
VLLVTHDVDEAILLADRAIVLSMPEPGLITGGSQIVADIKVDVALPRRRRDPAFAALRRELLGYLGVDDDDDDARASGIRSSSSRADVPAAPSSTAPASRRRAAAGESSSQCPSAAVVREPFLVGQPPASSRSFNETVAPSSSLNGDPA